MQASNGHGCWASQGAPLTSQPSTLQVSRHCWDVSQSLPMNSQVPYLGVSQPAADQRDRPGAMTSGLIRPSQVGPRELKWRVPEIGSVAKTFASSPFPDAPTVRLFFAEACGPME